MVRVRWSILLGAVGLAVLAAGCAPIVVGGATTAAVVAAQDRSLRDAATDARIQAQINELWFQHSVELHDRLDMTVTEGRVLLTGRATTPEMRLDAVRLAWQVDGVQEVINEIEVDDGSTLLDAARDTWTSAQLRSRIAFDSEIKSVNYTIDTVNGVVYLMGIARTQEELDRVLGHARALPYVKRVVSYVRL